MSLIQVTSPLTKDVVMQLRAGDIVSISGTIYTARDAAHMRLNETLKKGDNLPIDVEGNIIYYVGPTPTKPNQVIGSAGPTTSYRMDNLTVPLLERGLKGMIGKGMRSEEVIENMKRYGAVYFAAIGGAGALISHSIIANECVCYEDLGAEAIRKLTVKDFPAIVVIDVEGNNLYDSERQKYASI